MAEKQTAGIFSAEISKIVADHYPRIDRSTTAFVGKMATGVILAIVDLSEERQKMLSGADIETGRALIEWMLVSKGIAPELLPESQGSPESADSSSWYIEDWAGPVAGPTLLERDYGIARSTLYRWQKLGLVIAFPKGRRKFVFPLAQFVDGRPATGIAEILSLMPNPRQAWSWFISPNPDLAGASPIEWLRDDRISELVWAAEKAANRSK